MMNKLLKTFFRDFNKINNYYDYLIEKTKKMEYVGITNEWLIDNFYLLVEHKTDIVNEKKIINKRLRKSNILYYCLKEIAEMNNYNVGFKYLVSELKQYQKETNKYFSYQEIANIRNILVFIYTNKLVRYYQGVDGLKTGWTNEAGYCLTATMHKDNIRFIAVSMGAESAKKRNNDVVNMLNYGVNNYELVPVINKGEIVKTIEDIKTMPNVYHLVTKEGVSILKKKREEVGKITTEIVDKKLKVFVDNELYQVVDLETMEEIEKANFLDIILKLLKQLLLN